MLVEACHINHGHIGGEPAAPGTGCILAAESQRTAIRCKAGAFHREALCQGTLTDTIRPHHAKGEATRTDADEGNLIAPR